MKLPRGRIIHEERGKLENRICATSFLLRLGTSPPAERNNIRKNMPSGLSPASFFDLFQPGLAGDRPG